VAASLIYLLMHQQDACGLTLFDDRIREQIRNRLRLPPETRNEADLVHTTLFRYRGPLSDPKRFLAIVEGTSADAAAEVHELVVSKELVYPSLEAEVLARLPLACR